MKNPLTIVSGVVLLIVTILGAVATFSLTGDGLTENQRNLAFITILGLVGNAVPSILALLKSEATQNDIRNGVVIDKVKQAIDEKQVVTRDGPAVNLGMAALAKLLEQNMQATVENTEALQDNGKEGESDNGRQGV